MIETAAQTLNVAALLWTYVTTRPGGQMARLNDRQCEIVSMIRDGLDTEQIAEELDISRYTVRERLRDIAEILTGNPRGARMLELPGLAEQAGACDHIEAPVS